MSVAARSKTRVCGRSRAGIAGSNPTGGQYIPLWVLRACVRSYVCVVFALGWSLVQRSTTECGVSWVLSWILDNEEALSTGICSATERNICLHTRTHTLNFLSIQLLICPLPYHDALWTNKQFSEVKRARSGAGWNYELNDWGGKWQWWSLLGWPNSITRY
jgi:hypothetical protein